MLPEGGKFLISPDLARNAIIEWPDVDLILLNSVIKLNPP